MANSEIMTIEEVAEYLRVSERTVYDWAQKGEIPAGKLGTSWRFKRNEIERWVDRRLGAEKKFSLNPLPIKNVLTEDRVIFIDKPEKKEALLQLCEVLSTARQVRDSEELVKEIFRREELMSTGIGMGVGVPHVRLSSIDDIVMAVGLSKEPLKDYETIDDQPVRIVCMIAAHVDQHAKHIKILSGISRLLKDNVTRERLLSADSAQEVFNIMSGE